MKLLVTNYTFIDSNAPHYFHIPKKNTVYWMWENKTEKYV